MIFQYRYHAANQRLKVAYDKAIIRLNKRKKEAAARAELVPTDFIPCYSYSEELGARLQIGRYPAGFTGDWWNPLAKHYPGKYIDRMRFQEYEPESMVPVEGGPTFPEMLDEVMKMKYNRLYETWFSDTHKMIMKRKNLY